MRNKVARKLRKQLNYKVSHEVPEYQDRKYPKIDASSFDPKDPNSIRVVNQYTRSLKKESKKKQYRELKKNHGNS